MMSEPRTTPFRAVVIGCGKIGVQLERDIKRPKPATHAGAYVSHPYTQLVGLVEMDDSVRRVAQELYPQITCYENASACLEKEHPDIVSIATPPATHAQLIQLCATHGVHSVVCEKPLCYSLEDAQTIAGVVRKTPMQIHINYQRRFFPHIQKARRAIGDGRIGDVHCVTAQYSNGWFSNGSHIIDLLDYVLQKRIQDVYAFSVKDVTCPDGDVALDAVLHSDDGVRVVMQCFDQQEYAIHNLTIYGSKGSLEITRYGYCLTWTSKVESPIFDKLFELDSDHPSQVIQPVSMVEGVVAYAVHALKGSGDTISSVADSVRTMQILEAGVKSMQNDGRKIIL